MVWTNNNKTRSVTAVFGLAVLAFLTAAGFGPVRSAALNNSHVLSTFGDYKYGPDFRHFGYVNPNAPKGGTLREGGFGTFDSLNPFIIKGNPAGIVFLTYESLFEASLDEPLVSYGLIAESASYPADYSSVTFNLRQNARWHDGMPVTPEDVIFSFETLKAAHPGYAQYYRNVVKAERTGDHRVTFTFDTTGNRELPEITAQLTILPKHFWQGTDADGNKRDIMSTTLEPPLGSGPYRVIEVKPGTSLKFERVADYWGRDLPINIGRHNFDIMQWTYFRDRTVMLEAFKAGNLDVTLENQAKRWATAYKFPAALAGKVIKQVFKTKNPQGMSAFVFNTRRAKFADPRVRLAFNYAFDFDWTNKNIFFDQYIRTASYFSASVLAAKGLPQGLELEILEELRGTIPDEVFTTEYTNPTSPDRRASRKNFREALRLLKQAGWTARNNALTNDKTGKRMKVEFLIVSPDSERIVLPYKRTLDRLGMDVSLRVVDTSQYRNRLDNYDFDIVLTGWGQSLSPGNEQRDYWGSVSADKKGGRNLVGIKNPAIDKLIDRVIFAKNRSEQIAATKALDRVLLWNHYVVPTWHYIGSRVARWDRFGLPGVPTDYGFDFRSTWWYDAQKAAVLKGN